MFVVNLWITLWDSGWHIPVRPFASQQFHHNYALETPFSLQHLYGMFHITATPGGRIQWHHMTSWPSGSQVGQFFLWEEYDRLHLRMRAHDDFHVTCQQPTFIPEGLGGSGDLQHWRLAWDSGSGAHNSFTDCMIVVAILEPGLWWPLKTLRSDELMFLEALWFWKFLIHWSYDFGCWRWKVSRRSLCHFGQWHSIEDPVWNDLSCKQVI